MTLKRVVVVMLLWFMATSLAYAASNLFDTMYPPAEWYQTPSMFFRTATNPAQILPVMDKDGYRLPVNVGGAISITIGTTTFSASPVYADSTGSATMGLVDNSRRVVVNLGSYSAPLQVASTTVGSFTTNAYTIPLASGVQEITISLTGSNKQAWLSVGGSTPTVGNGIPFKSSVHIERLSPAEVIKVIASETIGAAWTQR